MAMIEFKRLDGRSDYYAGDLWEMWVDGEKVLTDYSDSCFAVLDRLGIEYQIVDVPYVR